MEKMEEMLVDLNKLPPSLKALFLIKAEKDKEERERQQRFGYYNKILPPNLDFLYDPQFWYKEYGINLSSTSSSPSSLSSFSSSTSSSPSSFSSISRSSGSMGYHKYQKSQKNGLNPHSKPFFYNKKK